MKRILIAIIILATGCTKEEQAAPITPDPISFPISDTSTRVVIAGHGYGNPLVMLWRDLNSGWIDTIYQGATFYKDTVWIPKMEWGELRIQSCDSVYLRKGCSQLWSVVAGSFKVKN
jgi:hypothetical protein